MTHFLNEVLEKSQDDSDFFLVTDKAKESSTEGSGGFNLLTVFELKGAGAGTRAVKEKVEVKKVLNRLRENDLKVDWTGEAFRVKPMVLYREVQLDFKPEIEVFYALFDR